jgi:hypothetical protein
VSATSTATATATATSVPLSDDPVVLKATIAGLVSVNADLTQKLAALSHRLDLMTRRMFGSSSERVVAAPGQTEIELGEIATAAPAEPLAQVSDAPVGPKRERAPRRSRAQQAIPALTEQVRLEPRTLSEEERRLEDGTLLVPIGTVEERRVDYVPPHFREVICARVVYGRPAVGAPAPVADAAAAVAAAATLLVLASVPTDADVRVAPPAAQLVPNGVATTGLIVQVAHAKFALHQPLHRQAKEYDRLGVPIAKSTMVGWLRALVDRLMPVYRALADQVRASNLIHSDDIPVDLLAPGTGETVEARFWSYLGNGQVCFVFTPDRGGAHPATFLAAYHGALMADALAQYRAIVLANRIARLGCWAHVRRKFYEARHLDRRAAAMVDLIAKLYACERRAERGDLAHFARCRRRWRLRQRYARHVLAKIKACLDEWQPGMHPGAPTPDQPLAKAVMYALNQWDALARYADTGDWPIDNNAAERIQRAIAVGRKNHLFMGSEGGGEVAAVLYSLIQSCALQGIDHVAYLNGVVERLLAGETDYASMTPGAVAAARRAVAPAA